MKKEKGLNRKFMINKDLMLRYSFLIFILALITCKRYLSNKEYTLSRTDLSQILETAESYEDSLEIIESIENQVKITNTITVNAETQAVESFKGEDAADDPAIWVNDKDPSKSLILGTNKRGGLYVYDLDGKITQYKKIGRINNVDIRDGFMYNNKEVVLVAGSNRSNNCISVMLIDKELRTLTDTLMNIRSNVDEVYGFCLYHDKANNDFYAFVNGKNGKVEQWQINFDLKAYLTDTFSLSSQPEGMVACDRNKMLYLGVEDEGIFKVSLNENKIPELLVGSDFTNSKIKYDIEGLALFSYMEKDYLMASSQGNHSYAIFELDSIDKYITSFIIVPNKNIDGAEETDGIEVTTFFLNSIYNRGMLIVQDGYNFEGDTLINQNFKLVSLEKILNLL